jgi:hypothetical protein
VEYSLSNWISFALKIHISSLLAEGDSVVDQQKILYSLWEKSNRSHHLVKGARDADLILFCDIAGPGWFEGLRKNPEIRRNPAKCFAISDSDRPMPLLHGIYTSAHKRLNCQSRYRSAGYNLYPENQRNQFVESFVGRAEEFPKKYLFSFTGRDSAELRKALFRLPPNPEAFVVNTTDKFNLFGQSLAAQAEWEQKYCDTIAVSKFCVCPRGVGSASVRLFESMRMGVAPIILSDDWIFPKGPEWSEFALIVPEKDIDRLYEIAKMDEGRALEMGRKARLAYETYFADEVYFNYLVDQMVDIQRSQKISEWVFWSCRHLVVAWWKLRKKHLMT